MLCYVNEYCIECISYLIQIYHIIMELQLLVAVYVLVFRDLLYDCICILLW